MADDNNITAELFDETKENQIAKIVLNGYNIEAGGPLGLTGAMRSFKIVEGELWDQWNTQIQMTVCAENGEESMIRIAALPAEEGEIGLVEFL